MVETIFKLEETGQLFTPRRGDAGFDITARTDPKITRDFIEYGTGVFLEPYSRNVHAYVLPRSSISKKRLALANSPALIDSSYRGEIKLRFRYLPWVFSDVSNEFVFDKNINQDMIYQKGDKIGQLVFFASPIIKITPVSSLTDTDRGEGGFGSTGI